MKWIETEAGRVPQCLVGDAMEKAKVPEEEQKQIRAAFTARTQIEVSTARNLIKEYAPLIPKKRTRAWPPGGLITIYRCLGEYENELVKNRHVMKPPPPQCPICLEDLDGAPALACGHQFHAACMQELAATAWANGATRTRGRGTAVQCPLCREQSYVQ